MRNYFCSYESGKRPIEKSQDSKEVLLKTLFLYSALTLDNLSATTACSHILVGATSTRPCTVAPTKRSWNHGYILFIRSGLPLGGGRRVLTVNTLGGVSLFYRLISDSLKSTRVSHD